MANGDKETGVTFHWLDKEFDKGDILLQEKITIESDDTVASLSFKSAKIGAELIDHGLNLVEKGNPPRIQQDLTKASYYSWPQPQDLKRFRENGGKFGSILDYVR
jgi:methionyl-tRNA formyltransferase